MFVIPLRHNFRFCDVSNVSGGESLRQSDDGRPESWYVDEILHFQGSRRKAKAADADTSWVPVRVSADAKGRGFGAI
jgi:hypothetical protein